MQQSLVSRHIFSKRNRCECQWSQNLKQKKIPSSLERKEHFFSSASRGFWGLLRHGNDGEEMCERHKTLSSFPSWQQSEHEKLSCCISQSDLLQTKAYIMPNSSHPCGALVRCVQFYFCTSCKLQICISWHKCVKNASRVSQSSCLPGRNTFLQLGQRVKMCCWRY